MEKYTVPALLTAGHALQQHPREHLGRGDGMVMGI